MFDSRSSWCRGVAIATIAFVGACDYGLSGFSSGSSGTPDVSDASMQSDADGGDDPDARVDDASTADGSGDGAVCGTNPNGPFANGFDCSKSSSCCSGACLESKRCTSTCLAAGAAGCSTQMSSCCVGAYCSVDAGTKCTACIPNNQPPELVAGVPDSKSCCGRKIKTYDGGVSCDDDD